MSGGDLRGGVLSGFFEWVVPTVALMLLGTTTAVVWLQLGDDPVFAAVDILLPTLAVAVIVWQGLRLQREELSVRETRMVAGWFGLGLVAMALFGLWGVVLHVVGQQDVPAGVQLMSQIALGGLFGLLVGVYAVRAREPAQEATQERLEREFTERQQETNELLNRILRHHLLNSLTVIRGQSEVLRDEVDEDEAEHLDRVVERVETMTETIEDIRSITRTLTEEPDLVPIDLVTTLHEEVRRLDLQYGDATFQKEVPSGPLYVAGDELLGRALRNVLANAVDHNDRPTPDVEVAVTETVDTVEVTVADEGPGIPADQREAVFDPSERGVDSDGEGLGLFLTRSIVEQYGGTVSAGPNDPRGTVVAIRLPRAGDLPERSASGPDA